MFLEGFQKQFRARERLTNIKDAWLWNRQPGCFFNEGGLAVSVLSRESQLRSTEDRIKTRALIHVHNLRRNNFVYNSFFYTVFRNTKCWSSGNCFWYLFYLKIHNTKSSQKAISNCFLFPILSKEFISSDWGRWSLLCLAQFLYWPLKIDY